jgi:dipeptidyl aminopeptidase/acylaminoacyl peptidase
MTLLDNPMTNAVRNAALALALLLGASAANAATVPLGDFFKDPEFTNVSLSPTGEYMTVSVPQGDRTVLAAFRIADMKLVSKWDYGEKKHIDHVEWVSDDRLFLYVTEKVGRFDARVGTADVFASNVDGSKRSDVPNGGTYSIIDKTWDDPDSILVVRSVDSAFLSRLNVNDGRVTTVASAPLRFGSFILDHDGNVRYAVGSVESGERVTLRRNGDGWVETGRAKLGDPVRSPLGFDADNKRVIFSVTDKGEPERLVRADPAGGADELLSSNKNVSINGSLLSSDEKELLAVSYMDGLPSYAFVDKAHPESKLYAGLINAFPDHAVEFGGISRDGRYVLIRAYSDVDPGSYYVYDSKAGSAKFLLASRDWIKPQQMSPMEAITVTARDGTVLHGYLTVPKGSSGKNLPLIMHPHGGPHGVRDEWGFNPEVQFLASRGYAVLQMNFRGSGGYGDAFEGKGYGKWGTEMVDDMTDAVNWAIARGTADRGRICAYGASYGGYAALQSVVREPDLYRCAIGYVGLYSMSLWMRDSDVSESEWGRNYQREVFPETEAGRQAQSPAFNVERIKVPLMLVHGAKDPRVPISQYNLLVKRLEEAGKPPEVKIVEDKEGHGFYDYQNQVDLYTAMEAFLDKHIGAGAPSSSP